MLRWLRSRPGKFLSQDMGRCFALCVRPICFLFHLPRMPSVVVPWGHGLPGRNHHAQTQNIV